MRSGEVASTAAANVTTAGWKGKGAGTRWATAPQTEWRQAAKERVEIQVALRRAEQRGGYSSERRIDEQVGGCRVGIEQEGRKRGGRPRVAGDPSAPPVPKETAAAKTAARGRATREEAGSREGNSGGGSKPGGASEGDARGRVAAPRPSCPDRFSNS